MAGAVAALAVGYAMAGVPWLAVLAIRARATPALDDLASTAGAGPGRPSPARRGDRAACSWRSPRRPGRCSSPSVVRPGRRGTVAAPVALIAALIAAVATGVPVLTGDTVPAVLYFPTLLVGIALLAGWT